MSALRLSPKDVQRLGVKMPRPTLDGIRLADLTNGDARTEHQLQVALVNHYRRALGEVSDVIAVPNQGLPVKMTPNQRGALLGDLKNEGVRGGAGDLLAEWDVRRGRPGNLGRAWVELKRAIKPSPLKREQVEFVLWRRSMGAVAGWGQCIEHCEALLDEAGAPPRRSSPPLRSDIPPWWYALGEEPPLWCDPPWVIGSVRLAGGRVLRLGRPS